MLEDGLNDKVVASGDDDDGQDVVGDGSSQDVSLVVHRLRNVVVRAPARCKGSVIDANYRPMKATYVPMMPSMA